jgi:CRP-like cAMP-binding protein
MAEVTVEAGQVLFQEGDVADEAYVIRQGKVEILKHAAHGEVLLATLGDGDVVGELALFEQGMPRSATARVIENVLMDIVTRAEFEEMLAQCPPRLMPIFMTVLDRLRNSNRRMSEKEAASAILEVDISKVVVTSLNEEPLFAPVEMAVAQLPLKIGGYLQEEGMDKRHRQNHVNIASVKSPIIVSTQHCQAEVHEGGIWLRDLGSRFTTIVNGKQIGRGKGNYIAPLQKGENTIQLGGLDSPVQIKLECV